MRVLRCHCGFEVRAQREELLVQGVRRHAWRSHGMALTDDEALLLTFRAELDEETTTATSLNRTIQPEEER